ncbi:hypothetical protein WR25_22715 [Diploscapter pachys]|uniref:Uncharacterized protein n=1 Tax=Diploscapter pachys TaxID=2018661 RepID=A0A2A2M510_9BILA|nr:hypothetical protein WR25_22715 [Diploscapter pachys]
MPGCSVSHGPSPSPPVTTLSTPAGRIVAASSPNFSVVSGVNGDGFSTIVLPASSAGPTLNIARIIGKFHGAMAPTTPIGTCRVSLSSVAAPFSHIPAPPTSPWASAWGLPCSRVSRRLNESRLARIASPSASIIRRRSAIGVAAQPGKASRAALTAASRSSRDASGACAITASVAGLTTSNVAEPGTDRPPMVMV